MTDVKPPLPPFTRDTATQKVQAAEDAWNTRDPEKVAQAYTVDSVWRNRDVFVTGRDEIVAFLTHKWDRELEYALRKNLWCFDTDRIAAAAGDVARISAEIEGQVGVMLARLTGLQDAWTGTASAQFQGVVAQWRGTQQQVRASLDSIGQVLGAAGSQYAEAEANATRMFS